MKRILLMLFLAVIVSISCFGLYYVSRRHIFDIEKPYYATVVDARWSTVSLRNGENVGLAGINIPDRPEDGPNSFPELVANIGNILVGRRVKVELVERTRTGAYHKYDLVRIYLQDGTCINTYLLENGLALYSHGYYRGKEREEEAEARAKKEGKGIWANKNNLNLLYVGNKHWEGIHYPECPEVKKIKPEDRIEYYSRPMAVHWYRDGYPEGCPYCDEIRKTKPEELQ